MIPLYEEYKNSQTNRSRENIIGSGGRRKGELFFSGQSLFMHNK